MSKTKSIILKFTNWNDVVSVISSITIIDDEHCHTITITTVYAENDSKKYKIVIDFLERIKH